MPQTSICPSKEELELVQHWDTPEDAYPEIVEHLSDCEFCRFQIVNPQAEQAWRRLQTHPAHHLLDADLVTPDNTTVSISSVEMIGGYQLLEKIGQGGMGLVYRARDLRLRREVALKILPVLLGHQPEYRLRFLNEARSAARLQHPGIVQVFDSGEDGDVIWISQELVRGGSLQERIDQGVLPPREAAELLIQLSHAVQHSHDHGVLHRDLKPSNILFADGSPKLADFGLARVLEGEISITRTLTAMGTPGFLSPEQAAASPLVAIDQRSDVYGLGAVLYTSLTGVSPFRATTQVETLKLVLEQTPLAPRQLQPTIPLDLQTICLKCLEKSPNQRYANAADLAADLERFLTGKPILARPTSLFRKSIKWAFRHPAAAALFGVSVISFVLLMAVWIQFSRELLTQTNLAIDGEAKADLRLQEQISANAALTEVVSFFTNDLLDAAIPLNDGVELTVVEVLARADAKITDRFTDQPHVEAPLRLAIGNSLRHLGQPSRAIVHLERADQLYAAMQDPTQQDAAFDGRLSLAMCLQNLNQHANAKQLLANLASEQWNPSAERRYSMRLTLSNYFFRELPITECIARLRDLVDECRTELGTEHSVTLGAEGQLGTAYFRAGEIEQAREIFEQVYETLLSTVGKENSGTLDAANNLAIALVNQQKYAEAEAIHRKTLELKMRAMGLDHPSTIASLHNLSSVIWRQGRHAEAIDLSNRAAEANLRLLGSHNPRTIESLYQAGRMALEAKKCSEGSEFFGKTFDAMTEPVGQVNQWVPLVVIAARLRSGAGEFTRAETHLEAARKRLAAQAQPVKAHERLVKQAAEELKQRIDSAEKKTP